MFKKEISCNFNSTPNNSNDFAIKPLCNDAAVFPPQGCWCCGGCWWSVPPWSLCPPCSVCDLGLFLQYSQWCLQSAVNFLESFAAHRGSRQAGFGRALPCVLDSGVTLRGSSADLGGSWEQRALLLARWEFLREQPEGEKHRFCLLCWLRCLG